MPPPYQATPSSTAPKKGLGTGAKIGIGCGAIILLIVIGSIIAAVMLGPQIKKFADEAQKNPTRTTATMMVSMSGGKMELIAEDDVNRRYTVRETKSGDLTTIYWDEKKQAPGVIPGDFTAIPTGEAEVPESGSVPVPAGEVK